MSLYESVFIARQDIAASQVESLTETYTKLIEDGGGKIVKSESWGLRGLAYKIKKNRKGHYVLLNIDAPSDAVLEMERQMRLNEDILRYLTIRVDAFEEGPSIILQNRSRDDRPRHGDRGDRGDRGRFDASKKADAGDKPPAKEADAGDTPPVKADTAPAEAPEATKTPEATETEEKTDGGEA